MKRARSATTAGSASCCSSSLVAARACSKTGHMTEVLAGRIAERRRATDPGIDLRRLAARMDHLRTQRRCGRDPRRRGYLRPRRRLRRRLRRPRRPSCACPSCTCVWNFSTRPVVSTNFILPVKNGWQAEQISTVMFFLRAARDELVAAAAGDGRFVVFGVNAFLHGNLGGRWSAGLFAVLILELRSGTRQGGPFRRRTWNGWKRWTRVP